MSQWPLTQPGYLYTLYTANACAINSTGLSCSKPAYSLLQHRQNYAYMQLFFVKNVIFW